MPPWLDIYWDYNYPLLPIDLDNTWLYIFSFGDVDVKPNVMNVEVMAFVFP